MVYVTHDQVEAMTLGDRSVVMSDGYIQQQGTPEALFKHPVNKFVAGFIGSPTMNFLDADLVEERGLTWVRGDGFMLPRSDETGKRMADAKNRNVTVGIRPSSFLTDASNGAPMELKVVVSEYLGAQSVLITRCSETDVVVETQSAQPLQTGSVQIFGVKTDEIMVFEKSSGRRL